MTTPVAQDRPPTPVVLSRRGGAPRPGGDDVHACGRALRSLLGERRRAHRLRSPRRREPRRHGRPPGERHRLRPHPTRAGGGLHGRRLRTLDPGRGRLPVDAGPGGDEPDHRCRRRHDGRGAGSRHRRPGTHHPPAQGEPPGGGLGSPVRAHHEVRGSGPVASGDPGDRAQGLQGGRGGEAGSDLHRASGQCRRHGGGGPRASAEAGGHAAVASAGEGQAGRRDHLPGRATR